jgi:hypothetical protein
MNAIGAMPIGAPGCPEFAFSTASMERNLIVFTQRSSSLPLIPVAPHF